MPQDEREIGRELGIAFRIWREGRPLRLAWALIDDRWELRDVGEPAQASDAPEGPLQQD